MTPCSSRDVIDRPLAGRGPASAWRPALLFALVALGGCKLVDEGINNEQLKEFREQGEAAGAGLKVPEMPKLGGADSPAAPVEGQRAPKTGPALIEEILSKRARCGSDVTCAKELLGQIRDLGRSAEQPMIALLAETFPTELRLESIRVMAFLRIAAGVPALGRLVNDQRPDVQREAVWALGQIRDVRAVETLARVLTTSGRPELRDAAAQALGSLREPEAAEALVAAWKGAEARTRAPIVSALGQIGDPMATDVLIDALGSQDDVTRLEAINGLEAVGALEAAAGGKARGALEALAADGATNDLVRRRARTVLGARDAARAPQNPSRSPLDDLPDDPKEP